jgi:type IX secretion system PorP/SprF family membrane protein
MKKKALIIVFLMFLFAGIKAQITGIYNFYTNNLFYFSPAHAGDKEQFAAFMDYREHLSNLVDPIRTGMFGIHSPITKKMNLGGIIKTDRMGLYETVSARLDYAFRTKIATDHTLAFGINGGGMQRNLNYTDAVVFDPGDPTLLPDYAKSYIWFAGASLNYRFKNFNFDFAIPVLYKTTQNFYQNYWTFLSYNIYTKSQKWMFQPSVALNYTSGKQFGYQANLMINYYDVFWFQPTYKANNSLAFSAGVNLKKFGIAYAYETNSSSLAAIGGPSHEIMLSYGLYKPKIQPEDTVNAYLNTI